MLVKLWPRNGDLRIGVKMDIIVFYIVIGWGFEFLDVVPSIIVLYIIIGLVPTPRHGTLPVD